MSCVVVNINCAFERGRKMDGGWLLNDILVKGNSEGLSTEPNLQIPYLHTRCLNKLTSK